MQLSNPLECKKSARRDISRLLAPPTPFRWPPESLRMGKMRRTASIGAVGCIIVAAKDGKTEILDKE